MKGLGTFLITIVLIVGLVNCVRPPPFIPYYDLTISSTEGGSVTTPGEGTFTLTYTDMEVVELVAEADEGYRFVEWTGDVRAIADVNAANTTITMSDEYSITANFEEDEVVTFQDPKLEAAVRQALAILERPIYALDMEGLTTLDAEEREISDLTGLEYANHVNRLELGYNQINDIAPLANLTSLTWLDLWDNQISDIAPLVNLTNVTGLSLAWNQISDISPLANLTSLTELNLYDNQISDISPLASLTKLVSLDLCNNQISDIAPLANLTSLTWLDLWDNQISDIAPLVNLTNVTWLSLRGNRVGAVSPLVGLTGLTDLDLWDNQISDISPLANLIALRGLHLMGNQISDISPVAKLTSLESLNLGGNQITDISALANLTSLSYLGLGHNQISDISALVENEGLGAEDVIHLGGNPLTPESTDIYIPQLKERGVVVYFGEEVATIADGILEAAVRVALGKATGPIYPSDLGGLTSLSASGLGITCLTGLEHCISLTQLWLQENRVTDISPLANLTNLKEIDIRGNQIADMWPLANLTSLTWVDLGHNQIGDISPLVENEGLGEEDVIILYGNPLNSDSINIYIPQLEARGVDVDY